MKKMILKCTLLFAATALAFTSCKKNEDSTPDDTTIQLAQASDESGVQGESDQSLEEIETWVSASSQAGARIEASPCGATIDSSAATRVLTFSGDNCDGTRTRTGKISFSLSPEGKKWKDAGAVLTITFTDYKVTRKSDGKSLVFNGSHILTNVSGGLLKNLSESAPITRKVTGTITVTFDDGTNREWTVSRNKVYTKISGGYQLAISGDPATGVVLAGTNRFGRSFSTVITSPIVLNTSCGWYQPVSGVKVHQKLERELTVTFGVDASGAKVTSGCAYGYQLDWTNLRGQVVKKIVQY